MKESDVLARPGPADHLVQFTGDEAVLARNVGFYLQEGVRAGDRMIVVATPAHTTLFREQLESNGTDVSSLVREGRLQVLDAERTLASVQLDGEPHWALFDQTVGALVRAARAQAGSGGVRAYGEMVDLLWKQGRLGAATRLEGFWNRLLQAERLALFCAYTVDVLAPGTKAAALQEMLSTHSHFLPERSRGGFESAVGRAMNEVLGEETVAALMPLIRSDVGSRISLPEAERTVLWLKKNLPPYADDVLAMARSYYEQECVPADPAEGSLS